MACKHIVFTEVVGLDHYSAPHYWYVWNKYGLDLQVDARNIDGSTPLCDACAAGSLDCVNLLLEYGATVNPPLFTFSPLHEACMGGML